MIFLFQGYILRFHVNLPGCILEAVFFVHKFGDDFLLPQNPRPKVSSSDEAESSMMVRAAKKCDAPPDGDPWDCYMLLHVSYKKSALNIKCSFLYKYVYIYMIHGSYE